MAQTQSEKLHAACDECRTRKLKCSGGTPACGRCEREKINCIYSPQKPMGRPRKRRRDEAPLDEALDAGTQNDSAPPNADYSLQTYPDNLMLHQNPSDEFSGLLGEPLDGAFSSAAMVPPYVETFSQPHAQDLDANFNGGSIDPLLWDTTPDGSGPDTTTPEQADEGFCTCLSVMYLALTDLQSINSFAFPAVIPRIRPALATASAMISCPRCPRAAFNAIQNVQSVSALLTAIAERFHKVLAAIDAEADRLESVGEKKEFRMGDNDPQNAHLHTNSMDCPMGFDIKIDAKDWRKLAKQMLKTEVLGGGRNPMSLWALLEQLEIRQRRWHTDASMHTEERTKMFGAHNMCRSKGDDAVCLRMVNQTRLMVNQMNWE